MPFSPQGRGCRLALCYTSWSFYSKLFCQYEAFVLFTLTSLAALLLPLPPLGGALSSAWARISSLSAFPLHMMNVALPSGVQIGFFSPA